MSEWGERIYKQGYEKGARESAVSAAGALIKFGLPLEVIANCIGLPLEEVEAIARQLKENGE